MPFEKEAKFISIFTKSLNFADLIIRPFKSNNSTFLIFKFSELLIVTKSLAGFGEIVKAVSEICKLLLLSKVSVEDALITTLSNLLVIEKVLFGCGLFIKSISPTFNPVAAPL